MWDIPVPVTDGAGPGRAGRHPRRFRRVRRPDAGDEEPSAAEAGVDPGPALEQVMQFRVGTTVSQRGPTKIPSSLPGRGPTWAARQDALHHAQRDRHGRAHLVPEPERRPLRRGPGDRDAEGRRVEDWDYINMTADTHPMHIHLVTFQVIGRTPFDVEAYEEANEGPHGVPGGIDPTPFATGPMLPPAPKSAASRTRSRPTPATSRRSGRSSTCRGRRRAADIRLPLPHRRARGQRHDAAIHRGGLTAGHRLDHGASSSLGALGFERLSGPTLPVSPRSLRPCVRRTRREPLPSPSPAP